MKRNNNGFKSSSIVNFISVVSGIVTLISTGPTAFMIVSNPHSYISKLMLIVLGITFSFWFLLTLKKAKSSFVSESETPFPKAFWVFLFNALPVSTGSKYDSKTKILIIYDASTEEVFHRIKDKYNDISLEIDCLNISGRSGLKYTIQEKLSKCDSLLFFYTDEMQRNKEIYDLINNWGLKNSHKAILAVTDCPFKITFNTIPMKEADSSLWRLLSRCTERSYQWLLQARLFRRVGIILSSLLAVVIGLAFNNYSNTEKRMEVLLPMYIETNISELHKKAEATDFTGMINGIGHYTPILRKKINEIFKNKKKEVYNLIKDKLDNYALSILNEINGLKKTKKENMFKSTVSFWASYSKENSIIKIASSAKQPILLAFKSNSNSIAGSSFINTKTFILWKKVLTEGEPAAWDWSAAYRKKEEIESNEILGHWRKVKHDGDFIIHFTNGRKGQYINLEKDPRDRQGYLCVSDSVKDDQDIGEYIIGVSIETFLEQPDYLLKDPAVNQLLIKGLYVLKFLPKEFIEDYIRSIDFKYYGLK